MTDARRVLVIGAGWAARRHVAALRAAGDRVVAVVDPDAARAATLAAPDGAICAATLDALLAAPPALDAAIVASPTAEHLAQATALARLGIPQLVEKPHRLPGEPVAPLRAALAAGGAPLQVGMTLRHHAGARLLRDALRDGRLGRVLWYADRVWFGISGELLPAWYFARRAAGGGVLATNGIHALDRAAWLLGEPLALRRVALADGGGRGVEDTAQLELESAGGTGVSISLVWARHPIDPSALRVVGTRGTARLDLDGALRIATEDGSEEHGAATEGEPFARQWRVFSSPDPRPGLDELEPSLRLVEQAYADAEVAA